MGDGSFNIASGDWITKFVVQGNVDKIADFWQISLLSCQHDRKKVSL
jgi:hypothetical protein